MEAFSLLKFWRNAAGDDVAGGGGGSDTDITMSSDVGRLAVESDEEEESFFDLEFAVPGSDEKEEKNDRDVDVNASDSDEDSYSDLAKKDGVAGSDFVQSPNDVFFKGTKPQSPISFLRSPPKFRVFMLFKKPKLEKTEATDAWPASLKRHQQSKRFAVKVEEVPIFSLLARVNSSRSNSRKQSSENGSSKRFPKDVVQKYLKLIKPLYIRASKRYTEKQMFSDEFSTSTPLSSPATAPVRSPRKQVEEKRGSRPAPLREACKHLGKSRSASSAVGIIPPVASRRDDSLLEQHDGIQSAILHCKRSYNSTRSRDFSVLSRIASEPCHEISIVNPSRNSTEEVKTRISI